VGANKDIWEKLSKELKRLEEEQTAYQSVSDRAGITFSFSFRMELHKEPWQR
jgi:hypothetical protein